MHITNFTFDSVKEPAYFFRMIVRENFSNTWLKLKQKSCQNVKNDVKYKY